jgi:hypothetical protein
MTARCVWCGRFKKDLCPCEEERLYKVADSVVMVGLITTLITSPSLPAALERIRDMFTVITDERP